MIPFICRAEKIDSDELVKGWYIETDEGCFIFDDNFYSDYDTSITFEDGMGKLTLSSVREIKPKTLEISFDQINWFNLDSFSDQVDANLDLFERCK